MSENKILAKDCGCRWRAACWRAYFWRNCLLALEHLSFSLGALAFVRGGAERRLAPGNTTRFKRSAYPVTLTSDGLLLFTLLFAPRTRRRADAEVVFVLP